MRGGIPKKEEAKSRKLTLNPTCAAKALLVTAKMVMHRCALSELVILVALSSFLLFLNCQRMNEKTTPSKATVLADACEKQPRSF